MHESCLERNIETYGEHACAMCSCRVVPTLNLKQTCGESAHTRRAGPSAKTATTCDLRRVLLVKQHRPEEQQCTTRLLMFFPTSGRTVPYTRTRGPHRHLWTRRKPAAMRKSQPVLETATDHLPSREERKTANGRRPMNRRAATHARLVWLRRRPWQMPNEAELRCRPPVYRRRES